MKILITSPVINSNVKNAVRALASNHLLDRFITSFVYPAGSLFSKIRTFRGRELSQVAWEKIVTFSLFFFCLRILAFFKTRFGTRYDWITRLNDFLDRKAANLLPGDVDAVYGYEDSCSQTFATAKQHGICCFYELPIMFYKEHKKIVEEEASLFPEFRDFLPALNETPYKIRKKDAELDLADHIIVASSATRNSLTNHGVDPKRISVLPYGSPLDYMCPSETKGKGKFTVLFVGSICPRKGLHYLVEAWKKLDLSNAELIFVGEMAYPSRWVTENRSFFSHIDRLPHSELLQVYQKASLFVFPSLVEGFGLVLLEAMACGLPVLTTVNTAGPDIVDEGRDGFVVPVRDVNALAEKIKWCYENSDELAIMSVNSRIKAEFFSWERYQSSLAALVIEHCSKGRVRF